MMAKENLVPCSTRLDKESIELIDKFLEKRPYWKRNTVINAVIWAVTHDFDEEALYDMVRRNRFKNQSIVSHYAIY